jgi:hypothetical protein
LYSCVPVITSYIAQLNAKIISLLANSRSRFLITKLLIIGSCIFSINATAFKVNSLKAVLNYNLIVTSNISMNNAIVVHVSRSLCSFM